jgi:hypothetical protein
MQRPLRALFPFLLVAQLTAIPVVLARPKVAKEADFRRFRDWAWFATGALTGFVSHELGHIITDVILRKSISFAEVHLGPFPFFAIQPCCNLSSRDLYVISSAGFWVQDVGSEVILSLAPEIRSQHQAFAKGILMLDITLSLGYAITGFIGTGPAQSDVSSMARALRIPSWQVGIGLAVPALIDMYRYFVPHSRWAPYASIQGKLLLFGVGFVL